MMSVVDINEVYLECLFADGESKTVDIKEIGKCDNGDILLSETSGWFYLQYNELNDLSEEGKTIL